MEINWLPGEVRLIDVLRDLHERSESGLLYIRGKRPGLLVLRHGDLTGTSVSDVADMCKGALGARFDRWAVAPSAKGDEEPGISWADLVHAVAPVEPVSVEPLAAVEPVTELNLDDQLRAADLPAGSTANIDAYDWRVLRSVLSGHTARSAASQLRHSVDEVAEHVRSLMLMGLLAQDPPPRPTIPIMAFDTDEAFAAMVAHSLPGAGTVADRLIPSTATYNESPKPSPFGITPTYVVPPVRKAAVSAAPTGYVKIQQSAGSMSNTHTASDTMPVAPPVLPTPVLPPPVKPPIATVADSEATDVPQSRDFFLMVPGSAPSQPGPAAGQLVAKGASLSRLLGALRRRS